MLSSLFNTHPWEPTERIYWVYLLSSFAIALSVYFLKSEGPRTSLRSIFRFCFPRHIYTHRSTFHDVLVFLINQLLYATLLAPYLLGALPIAHFVADILGVLFPSVSPIRASTQSVQLLYTFAAFLAVDGSGFVSHYLMHRMPFLWQFHKVHHSAEVMSPLTFYRNHPVNMLVTQLFTAVFLGFTYGIFEYFFVQSISSFRMLQINFFVFFINLVGVNLRHSHVWISYPSFLSHLLISPSQHQVHHSSDPRHFGKNYGDGLAIWDVLAGTLYIPKEKEILKFGLPNEEKFASLSSLYFRPLTQALKFTKRPSG